MKGLTGFASEVAIAAMSTLYVLALASCAVELETIQDQDRERIDQQVDRCFRIGESERGQQVNNAKFFIETLVRNIAPSMLDCAIEPIQIRSAPEIGPRARIVSQRFRSISPQVLFIEGGGHNGLLYFDPIELHGEWSPLSSHYRFWRQWLARFEPVIKEWQLPAQPSVSFELVQNQGNVLLIVEFERPERNETTRIAAYGDCGINPSLAGCKCRHGGIAPVALESLREPIAPVSALNLNELPFTASRVIPGFMSGLDSLELSAALGVDRSRVLEAIRDVGSAVGAQTQEQLLMMLWGMQLPNNQPMDVRLHDRLVSFSADELSFLQMAATNEDNNAPSSSIENEILSKKRQLNLSGSTPRAGLLAAMHIGTAAPSGVCSPVEIIRNPVQKTCEPWGMTWNSEQNRYQNITTDADTSIDALSIGPEDSLEDVDDFTDEGGTRNVVSEPSVVRFREALVNWAPAEALGCAQHEASQETNAISQHFGPFVATYGTRGFQFQASGLRKLGVSFINTLRSLRSAGAPHLQAQVMTDLGPFAELKEMWKSKLDVALLDKFDQHVESKPRFRGLGHDIFFLSSVAYVDCGYNPASPGCEGRATGIAMVPVDTHWEETRSRMQYYIGRLDPQVRDVAFLSLTGKDSGELAEMLSMPQWRNQPVTADTVRAHLTEIYERFAVHTRAGLLSLILGIDFEHARVGTKYQTHDGQVHELTSSTLYVFRGLARDLTAVQIDSLPDAEEYLHGRPAAYEVNNMYHRVPSASTYAQLVDYLYLATGGASHWPIVDSTVRPDWLDAL